MVQPGKATLAWRILLPELCDRLFCCFIVYVQPPLALWPCQLFMTDRKKKKKVSFMFVGKLRLAETRLYWRSERQISSQHWTFVFLFHAWAPAESPEPLLMAFSKSWLLPLSPTCFGMKISQIHVCLENRFRQLNSTSLGRWSHGRRLGLWTQLWRHDRLAHITQGTVPLVLETCEMSDCGSS